jgi:hypothetical protein
MMDMAPGGTRARAAVLLLMLAARAASAQEPFAQRIVDATPRVEHALGLPFKSPPRFAVRSREQMARALDSLYDDERSRRALANEERVLRILGVIPDTLDWRALQLAILREQVVGYYDPAAKTLYLEDDPDDPALGIVIPHELAHALQDQYEDLDSLARITGDDDRVLAAHAALEGQATLVAFEVALGLGQDLPGSDDAIRESVEDAMTESPVLASAPLFVRRLEVFPYLEGLAFMMRLRQQRPDAQPLGADLPVSTAQVLHPSYYDSVRRVPPVIAFAADSGARVIAENDIGEYGTRALLEQMLHDGKRATRASAGWSADRFALVETDAGSALAWITVWETPRDASEFADAARRMAARRRPHAQHESASDTDRFHAGGRTITIRSGIADGRSIVIYTDAPDAMPEPIQLVNVRVRAADR